MYTKKLSLNRLTKRTFSVFWIALFVMTTLLVILPYFDGHLYSELDDNEIATYQQKLVESIRNNKIKGLLAGVPVLPTDKFDSARPVLITPNKEVFGALGEEKTHILQFFDESTNFTIPQRKTFRDIQIAGPFFLVGLILSIAISRNLTILSLGEEASKKVMVSSTKSNMGHLLGAAGGVEAIVCTQAINFGIVPPTINYQVKDEECDLDIVPNELRKADLNIVMSNSLGFGGHNASVILRKYVK